MQTIIDLSDSLVLTESDLRREVAIEERITLGTAAKSLAFIRLNFNG